MDNPWKRLGARPHLTLLITRLPKGEGWWLPSEQAIVLDDRLPRIARRCVLGHELEHAEAGDVSLLCAQGHLIGPDGGRLARRQELKADIRCAQKLVDLDDLVGALRLSRCEHEIAEILDVTVEVLQTRLDWLSDRERLAVGRRVAAFGEVHTP